MPTSTGPEAAPLGRVLLIENGESRGALAAARALAATGWTVGVGAPRQSHAAISRATSAWHRIPAPGEGLERFQTAVQAAVALGRYDVVYGVGDAEVLALSAIRHRIGAVFPYADDQVVRRVFDKQQLMGAAATVGLRTPRTVVPTPEIVAALRGPAVVKNRLNGEPGNGQARIEVALVRGPADAAVQIQQMRALGGDPLLQEVVRGRLMALTVLRAASGERVAVVQQRADRISPPAAGTSARARTVAVDLDLESHVAELLELLGWVGLSQLQFLETPGEPPALIDLNGRFYGSLALAMAAGVNLADLWTRLALGMPVPARTRARVGVEYQWLEGDLRRALIERRGGLGHDLLDCLKHARTAQHSLWRFQDPAPAAQQVVRLAGRAVRTLNRHTEVRRLAPRAIPPYTSSRDAMESKVPAWPTSPSMRRSRRTKQPLGVWLLDASLRQMLVCARELGQVGYRVGAMDRSAHVSTFSSRWCEQSVVVPDFSERPDAFADAILDVLKWKAAPVLIPGHDGSIAALRRRRAEIELLTALALPDERVLDITVDKGRTLALAADLGIAVPVGVPVLESADVRAAVHEVGLPAVVKPLQSWVEKAGSGVRVASSVAMSPGEATKAAGQILEAGGQAIVQRWLSGDREAVSLFVARGKVMARFAQVAHRMYPSLGGTSVLRESIPLPGAATDAAQRLVQAIGLEGYAEVEFRRDAEDRPVLMEVNPRLSASVEVAVRAGVNFPVLLYQWAAGMPLEPVDGYRIGLRMRWLGGDLRWLRENLSSQGRPDIVPRRAATKQFLLDFVRPAAYDYVDLADMRPAIVAAGGFLSRAPWNLGRALRRDRT